MTVLDLPVAVLPGTSACYPWPTMLVMANHKRGWVLIMQEPACRKVRQPCPYYWVESPRPGPCVLACPSSIRNMSGSPTRGSVRRVTPGSARARTRFLSRCSAPDDYRPDSCDSQSFAAFPDP
jgi:hypothetical protein